MITLPNFWQHFVHEQPCNCLPKEVTINPRLTEKTKDDHPDYVENLSKVCHTFAVELRLASSRFQSSYPRPHRGNNNIISKPKGRDADGNIIAKELKRQKRQLFRILTNCRPESISLSYE